MVSAAWQLTQPQSRLRPVVPHSAEPPAEPVATLVVRLPATPMAHSENSRLTLSCDPGDDGTGSPIPPLTTTVRVLSPPSRYRTVCRFLRTRPGRLANSELLLPWSSSSRSDAILAGTRISFGGPTAVAPGFELTLPPDEQPAAAASRARPAAAAARPPPRPRPGRGRKATASRASSASVLRCGPSPSGSAASAPAPSSCCSAGS